MQSEKPKPVIVALDVPDAKAALKLVDQLSDCVDIFKVGLQLFSAEGPGIIDKIIRKGKLVFADLKLHDIPNTVAGALESLVRPGLEFVTVHGLGGREMLTSAATAVDAARQKNAKIRTRLLCVTVLTSLDDDDLDEVGIDHTVGGEVMNLARLAKECGVAGLVASPEEAGLLRQELGPEAVIVTPGVRLPGQDVADQKRVATPKEAIANGANFVVMGRSVIGKPKPKLAVQEVLDSLQ